MNVKDFRIGNFVKCNEHPSEYSVITSITETDITCRTIGNNGYSTGNDNLDFINPITLTGEWLVRLGFKQQSSPYSGVFINHNIPLIEDGTGFKMTWHNNAGTIEVLITTVHQLQNLHHTLTSEELVLNPDREQVWSDFLAKLSIATLGDTVSIALDDYFYETGVMNKINDRASVLECRTYRDTNTTDNIIKITFNY